MHKKKKRDKFSRELDFYSLPPVSLKNDARATYGKLRIVFSDEMF